MPVHPLEGELTVQGPLPVEGALPPELEGMLLRAGPGPGPSPPVGAHHGPPGDGMVHAVELAGGRAVAYRCRWVRTMRLAARLGAPLPRGPLESLGGTGSANVLVHAGRILAVEGSGLPRRLDGGLGSVGVEDFDGMLATPVSSHPKADPDTGGLALFGVDPLGPPYLRYHELDAGGDLVHATAVPSARPVVMHDFAATATRVAFFDMPLLLDLELGAAHADWRPSEGARVGVLERGSVGDLVRWCPAEPGLVSHVVNAYDDGAVIVADLCRSDPAPDTGDRAPEAVTARARHLERWRIDPRRGRVETEVLDDRPVDLPRVDPARVGRPYRVAYCAVTAGPSGPGGAAEPGALVRYDLVRREGLRHSFGPGTVAGEPIVVPASPGAAEEEGWVLSIVEDRGRGGSNLTVLDASAFAGRPLAVIGLPGPVRGDFHGSWVPAAAYR
jgi:carotenoid cleavage dioxygenase